MEPDNNLLEWAKSRITWLERELCIETERRMQLEARLRQAEDPNDDPDEPPFAWTPPPGQWVPGTTAGKDCRGNIGYREKDGEQ